MTERGGATTSSLLHYLQCDTDKAKLPTTEARTSANKVECTTKRYMYYPLLSLSLSLQRRHLPHRRPNLISIQINVEMFQHRLFSPKVALTRQVIHAHSRHFDGFVLWIAFDDISYSARLVDFVVDDV